MIDPAPAFMLWVASNILAGFGYLIIPHEIGHWVRGGARGSGFFVLARLFQVMFITCAAHHFAMVSVGHAHPFTNLVLITDAVMGFVTIVAAYVMWKYRSMIRGAFQSMLSHWKEWTRD